MSITSKSKPKHRINLFTDVCLFKTFTYWRRTIYLIDSWSENLSNTDCNAYQYFPNVNIEPQIQLTDLTRKKPLTICIWTYRWVIN